MLPRLSSDTVGTSYCGDRLFGVSIAIAVVQIIVIANLGQSAPYSVLLKVAGLGYHFEYVQQTPGKLVALQKKTYLHVYGLLATQILDFPFTVTPAKLSILLFYLRVSQPRSFRVLSCTIGFLVLGQGIGVFFATVFQCSPVQCTWDNEILGGSFFNQQAFYRYVSPPNTFTDLVILVKPMPIVWRSQTRLTLKGLVTSILRMVVFFQESALTDPTWTSVNLGIWTVLEGGIIIVAARLPPIWPLIVRFLPNKLMNKHRDMPGDAGGRLYPRPSYLKPKPS
ncbi:hypothetical protein BDW71DRAFT_201379 [Aspergillus fruticulosus]